jgi:hypothetical protein
LNGCIPFRHNGHYLFHRWLMLHQPLQQHHITSGIHKQKCIHQCFIYIVLCMHYL